MSQACHRFWKCYKTLTFCSLLRRCTHNPLRLPRETASERPKVVRTPGVFDILTSKCASRHNGVRFFDISTSKSGLNLVCFVHFEMCFSPQRRALFRHLNFQKWSENGVFCTFWLGDVLRATTACNFSSLICYFSTFRSHKSLEKTQCFATFLPFRAPAPSFFWLFLFSDLLSSTPLFSDSSHLCFFSSVHTVGSLTSKLPSINQNIVMRDGWSVLQNVSVWEMDGQKANNLSWFGSLMMQMVDFMECPSTLQNGHCHLKGTSTMARSSWFSGILKS